jgi:hypothetical protein
MEINPSTVEPVSRLKRIQTTSRFLKIVFLLYFVVVGLFLVAGNIKTPIRIGEQTFGSFSEIPAELKVYEALRAALGLLAAIAFYGLLDLYEKGIIFSAKNVSHIRRLGELAIGYCLLKACQPIFEWHGVQLPVLSLNFFLTPWFMMGCLLIIVAWVMAEGRKIQEEQELTV